MPQKEEEEKNKSSAHTAAGGEKEAHGDHVEESGAELPADGETFRKKLIKYCPMR